MVTAPLKIAIIGGGLAGTVLMSALLEHPHLDVHLYEANAELKERGASVGLSHNARRALRLIGLGDVVGRARGVKVDGFRMVVGEGLEAGNTVFDIDPDLETVHRAALLGELMKLIPDERLHLSKRLTRIEGGTVYFQDGTEVTADLVVGADGIHGNVRKFVLGDGHPGIDPIFAGFWDSRVVLPTAEAVAKLGTHRIDLKNPRQHMYVGNGCMLFHDIIDDGENVCVVAGGITPAEWGTTEWKQNLSREWLDETFKGFGDFGQDGLDLLCGGKETVSAFMEWESAETPKLYNGPLVMIGDAAHATTPWQGSGFALAIEDSLILKTVLGKCNSSKDLPAALEAYDQVMRPRGRRIIESSRGTGFLSCGSGGLQAANLAEDFAHRWDFILFWETESAMKEAIDIFERIRSS